MKKRNILLAASLGFVQLTLSNVTAFAQTKDSTSLNEVVITASRSPKRIGDIGKIVKVITGEEIERAQGRTLPELLNTVAGLTLAGSGSNPGNIQSVYLRGASSANTLILIDGIAVNDASGISGEYNIGAIDISQLERIEILKGASSTLYGSDAVAGVINLITKKGDGKMSANALLSGGSYDTYKASIGLNGQIDKTRIGMTLSNLDSKGISAAEPSASGAKFDKDAFSQLSFGLNLAQYMSSKFTLSAGLQANRNNADLDGGAYTDEDNYTYAKTAILANLGAKYTLNKGELNVIFSQNHVKNLFDNPFSLNNNKGDISNIEGIFSYQFSDFLDITSGANYKYASTDQKYTDFIYPEYSSSLDSNNTNHISSIYTSLFFKGGDFFRMELGGRYNNHSQYGKNFTYTINPSILINEQLKFYVNVSSAYRVPSLYQLYSDYGNKDLKPETSRSYETGFQLSLLDDKINFTASAFKRDLKDVIDFGLMPSGFYGYVNQNQQKDKGFELELGLKPNEKASFNIWYAYVTGKVKLNETDPQTFNLFRRPKHSIGANLGYAFTSKFYSSLNLKWNGTRTDQYYDTSAFNVVNTDLKKFTTLDAYFQYKANKTFNLFADIKNIFDSKYNEFAGYTAKGFNFNAGVNFNFR